MYSLEDDFRRLQQQLEHDVHAFFDQGDLQDQALFYVQYPIKEISFLDFLAIQSIQQRYYFKDRTQALEYAGLGLSLVCDDFKTCQSFLPILRQYPFLNLFFKSAFPHALDQDPEFQAVLPLFSLRMQDGEFFFSCQSFYDAGRDAFKQREWILEQIFHLKSFIKTPFYDLPKVRSHRYEPSYEDFDVMLQSLLKRLNHHDLRKVVLARKCEFSFFKSDLHALSMFALAHHCKRLVKRSYLYLWQDDFQDAQLSFSPELLYGRKDRSFLCDALAGTRARGSHFQNDAVLEEALISSEKEILEHQIVAEGIQESMSAFAEKIALSKKEVMKLARVQHLYQQVSGTLKPKSDDFNILRILSPTAAVCGEPKDAALSYLLEKKQVFSPWYRGYMGLMSADFCSAVVAIRMAVMQEGKLSLYSGGGIVPGSNSASEWEELDLKIATFMTALTQQ